MSTKCSTTNGSNSPRQKERKARDDVHTAWSAAADSHPRWAGDGEQVITLTFILVHSVRKGCARSSVSFFFLLLGVVSFRLPSCLRPGKAGGCSVRNNLHCSHCGVRGFFLCVSAFLHIFCCQRKRWGNGRAVGTAGDWCASSERRVHLPNQIIALCNLGRKEGFQRMSGYARKHRATGGTRSGPAT